MLEELVRDRLIIKTGFNINPEKKDREFNLQDPGPDFFVNQDLLNDIKIRGFLEGKNLWNDEELVRTRLPQAEFIPGTLDALASFITREPQYDPKGNLRYLLTSGLAVEVITGVSRFHHDTDLVILDQTNNWWVKYATDNVVAQKYWAGMKFEPEYLQSTAWEAHFRSGDQEYVVATVHPAIILAQKLSNAWGRPPRERDLADVETLASFWFTHENGNLTWSTHIGNAIRALPETERQGTYDRVKPYLKKTDQAAEVKAGVTLNPLFLARKLLNRLAITA